MNPEFIPVTVIEQPFRNPTKEQGTDRKAVGIPLAAVPWYYRLVSLRPFFEAWRDRPERRRGITRLSGSSFAHYVLRYTGEDTVMFQQQLWTGDNRLTVIFDYHPQGPDMNATGNCTFRVETTVSKTETKRLLKEIKLPVFEGKAP